MEVVDASMRGNVQDLRGDRPGLEGERTVRGEVGNKEDPRSLSGWWCPGEAGKAWCPVG